MPRKLLFIDRDGTLVLEPPDYQLDSFEKLRFYPGVFQYLGKVARMLDYELVMVTNQDGLGTESFPESSFWPIHELIVRTLEGEGIRFREILIDRSFPHEQAPTRKPRTGLLTHYLNSDEWDLAHSWVIGDRLTDMELARNLGCKGIFLANDPELGADEASDDLRQWLAREVVQTTSWADIWTLLRRGVRTATVHRTTKETDVLVQLDLDGTGQADIRTGIGFFDHMLEQIARHGGLDLRIRTKGDLHVDAHHTIEDTALALGQALRQALGDKRGISRYGFCLPMDDCLAQVAIDFGGRPWLVWEAEFKRECIGKMPTEMFFHFFKSLSDTAAANIHIRAAGQNEHHKIEAIFKALARAIRMAKSYDADDPTLPSTKGTL